MVAFSMIHFTKELNALIRDDKANLSAVFGHDGIIRIPMNRREKKDHGRMDNAIR